MSSPDVVALLNQVLQRLSVIEAKIGSGAGEVSTDAAAGLPPRIVAFDAYCAANLDPFVAACDKLGGDAQAAGAIIKQGWAEMRSFLLMATQCKEPAQAALPGLLGPLAAQLQAAKKLVNRNEWENHTKTVSEGISCLNWYVSWCTITR
jgi:adenylyl cyclase-associated protein